MIRAGHLRRGVSDLADSELVLQNQLFWVWVGRVGGYCRCVHAEGGKTSSGRGEIQLLAGLEMISSAKVRG